MRLALSAVHTSVIFAFGEADIFWTHSKNDCLRLAVNITCRLFSKLIEHIYKITTKLIWCNCSVYGALFHRLYKLKLKRFSFIILRLFQGHKTILSPLKPILLRVIDKYRCAKTSDFPNTKCRVPNADSWLQSLRLGWIGRNSSLSAKFTIWIGKFHVFCTHNQINDVSIASPVRELVTYTFTIERICV